MGDKSIEPCILSTFMRDVWSTDLACRRNYTKLSDIQKQKLLPNHGIFSVAKSPSQNSSCSTCVSLLLQKLRQDTYATPLQMPTSKLQGADHQHFWCTNTAPAAPLEHPKLGHHFCLRNNTKTQKSSVLLHFFWLKQAQILEASLEKAQYFY